MAQPFQRCANLWCFLTFFCLCFFLETITFTYLVSAIQSIERQFQIPSRMSGALVAASDIGYIVTVVILAYLGSRGNRARWIGGGCLLIGVACLIIALPTFIFPSKETVYNEGELLKEYGPLTKEDIKSEEALSNTVWGKRLEIIKCSKPEYMYGCALDLFFGSGKKQKDALKRSLTIDGLSATDSPFDELVPTVNPDDLDGVDEAATAPVSNPISIDDETANPVRPKRQAPENVVLNADKEKKKEIFQSNLSDIYTAYLDKKMPFDDFARAAREMINKPVPFMIMAGGLPFSTCNNQTMLIKQRMKQAACAQKDDNGNRGPFAFVFIGIMLIGVGHSMPWTLGMPMIDDNVKKQNTPLYFAGVFFIRIMGPVVGFLLGALCTKLYVKIGDVPQGITPMDPRWIGAWWLGFLVVFATLTIPSIILMCFPDFKTEHATKNMARKNRTPPGAYQKGCDTALVNGQEKAHYGDGEERKGVVKELKSFGSSLVEVLKSPVYTGSLIGRLFDAFAFKGYFVFKPKYLENHYGLPSFKSSIFMGVLGVVGFAGGVVLGSLLMKKARLEGRRAAFYVGMCSLITAILSFSQMGLGCHSVINQIGHMGVENGNSTHPHWPAFYGCDCDAAELYPVCDQNRTAFYSPCHAGCQHNLKPKNFLEAITFYNCTGASTGEVSRDWCEDDCNTPMIIYFVISTLSGIIGGSSVIPGVLIILRSVHVDHRSVALGFSGFIVSLISTFPSPPVYGLIIDTACIFWTKGCGGEPGSCQIYDPRLLRQRIYIFHGALRCVALIFDIWVWYYAKGLKLMEEDTQKSPKPSYAPVSQQEIQASPEQAVNETELRMQPPAYPGDMTTQVKMEIEDMQVDPSWSRRLST